MNPMFYFLLALTAALAVTASPGEPIRDTDGKILHYLGFYYVLPRNPGAVGGGLTLAPRGDKKCPLYVGQEISELNKGLPARLSNRMSSSPVVVESDDLRIQIINFKPTNCGNSIHWGTAEPENVTEPLFIEAGAIPSIGFQIKKTEGSGYKFVFCPFGSNCTDVGIFVDRNGARRFALTSTPLEVVFKRVGTETSSKIMAII